MSTLLDKYISLATNKPWYLLVFTIIVTVIFGFHLTQLKVDSTPYFIDSTHPERLEEGVVREQFTSTKEQAFVLVVAKDQDVFNYKTLNTVRSLSDKFTNLSLLDDSDLGKFQEYKWNDIQRPLVEKVAIDGLTKSDISELTKIREAASDPKQVDYIDDLILRIAPVHKVRSLTNIENITASDGFLEVGPLVESLDSSQSILSEVKKNATDNPLYRDILLSSDAKATNIQIEFNIPDYDSPNLVRSYEAVLAVISNEQTEDSIHLGGTPVVNSQIVQVLEQDNAVFFPVVILVIAFVLYLSFRRSQGVWLPLLIAVLSVVWAMGFMSWVGIKQNVVITALPVFLVTIAVADSIHYLAAYYLKLNSVDKTTAIRVTLKKLFLPLFLTSITTVFGFVSLTITDLIFVREFGIVMCAGVIFAFILTIILLPAVLQISRIKEVKNVTSSKSNFDIFNTFGLKVNDILKNNLKISITLLFAFSLLIGYLSTKITFDQHNTVSFDEETLLRKDDVVLNQYLGGTSPLNISFHASEQGAFAKAENILALEKISNHLLKTYDTIGYVTSPVDFLKRIHQVVGDDEGKYLLPENMTSEMVSQYYLLYETGSGQEIRNVLDETYTNARIAILGHTDQASVWKKIITESDSYIKANLPAGIEYKFSGVGNIQKANLDQVISSQTSSLAVGIVLILAAMMLALRSILMGIVGAIPLVLTLGTLFAFLAVTGIHLDIGTSLISALVFGIGVDYSIHFLTHFRRYYQDEGRSLDDAIVGTLSEVSNPIAINSLALALGFLVLALSSYAPIAYLGLFVSGTMILCAVWVLLILPMLLRLLMPQRAQKSNACEPMVILKDESNEAL